MSERKTALVTGASRGIGRAIASHLATAGFQLAVHYNANAQAAARTWAQLDGSGHVLISADLTAPAGAEQLAHEAKEVLGGRVDVLIHSAGIYEKSPIFQMSSLADWREALRRQMQVHFFAGADLAYLLAPAMAQAGWGKIVLVSSRAGIRGESRHCGYAASKAAQINLVKSLAVELGPQGIGCYGVAPGWTETDMAGAALAARGEAIRAAIPLGRVATPDDVAATVAFLATPAADYLTGNTIDVNGASYLH